MLKLLQHKSTEKLTFNLDLRWGQVPNILLTKFKMDHFLGGRSLALAGCYGKAYSTEISDQGRSAKQFWYRGVRVSERIIFQPETLTAQDIKSESNQEVRRVMTERYGEWKVMNDSNRLIIEAGMIRGRNN